MINLQDGELKDILPVEFTRQPQVVAISYALKQAYGSFREVQDTVYVYAYIDGAPEYILDILAVELNVRYYSNSLNVETKRSLIKTALLVAMKDGTVYAVNSVINTVFGDGSAVDWYDYGGVPNHYKSVLEVERNYDIGDLLETVNGIKRLTARLDGITMHSDGYQAPLFFGSILVERVEETIGCEPIPNIAFFIGDNDEDEVIGDDNGRYLYGVTT